MTILPKKKVTKEKNESENVDHTLPHHNHSRHHPSTSDSRHDKVARARNALPASTREDVHPSHDPGNTYDPLESTSGHNKRRHRSSPHRNHSRKHRGGHTHSAHTHTPVPTPNNPQQNVSYEDDDVRHNSDDEHVPPAHPENIEDVEKWFENAIKEKKGFTIKKMGEDGACLFRAVADQVYGDQEMHSTVRKQCIEYLAKNADYYSHYVTEDFTTYLNRKRMDHCHGNHLEIQAMCEIYNRPIEVYQYSIEPINTFHSSYKTDNEPIRLSYHSNVHYNGVIDPYKQTIGVGLGLPVANFQPGLAEKHLVHDATRQSEELHIEQAMLEDKLRETDWEVTQETIQEQVARESYLQWLRDNEKRVRTNRTASATCSSSSEYAQFLENSGSPEARLGRSPRHKTSAPNSNQNSPQRVEHVELHNSPHITEIKGSSPKPMQVPIGSDVQEGATGGYEFETSSLVNQYPQSIYADFANYSEEDILAQVIAQSQQEYLDTLKKNASSTPPPGDNHAPSCSNYQSDAGKS
ncbi:OTU domain-containing protein 5-B-like [Ruditapes philippinarum]|uniref:OTU domain-containing protein 5-B-like n=1 Tax=Ruditapes philippinarum TaxID=129788 RepID=UPI00295C05D7|nr:OTU domain-containing protein 5-B-like [Ruditapes philippinarum]